LKLNTKTMIAMLALVIMGTTIPMAAAQANGIQYQQAAGIVTLTTDEMSVKVTGNNQAPHFHWWDTNDPTVDYHVMFVKLFEANDTNANSAFDLGTDHILGPVFPLPTTGWDFSGFDTDEVNGSATYVHFNFTTTATHDPRPETPGGYGNLPALPEFDVMIQIRVHMDLSEPGQFKFDLVIDGWMWSDNESILVLQFTVTESNHGQNQGDRDPYGFTEKTQSNFTFRNAFMECADEAFAAENQVQVMATHGEGTGAEAGESIYLAFTYFGNDTLEYDPTLGLLSADVTADNTTLLLIGGAVAALVVIALIVVKMRK
jgi:hypothetical protein